MKVKIISDGTAMGTKVIDPKSGEMLEGVIGVDWSCGLGANEATATITLVQVPVELRAKAKVHKLKKRVGG